MKENHKALGNKSKLNYPQLQAASSRSSICGISSAFVGRGLRGFEMVEDNSADAEDLKDNAAKS
jgi:hypothetical protein